MPDGLVNKYIGYGQPCQYSSIYLYSGCLLPSVDGLVCYRFIISVRINVIFIHSETSRIAQTYMTHLFKESETRQCEGNERKQGNVVIDKFVHIRYIFLLAHRAYS
jgi:hypothetical protein